MNEDTEKLPPGEAGATEGPVDQADGHTATTPLKTPYTTGIAAITYPCGCQAEDFVNSNLPAHCPDHPEQHIERFVDRHGTVFEPGAHAINADGTPKLDSIGKLIRVEHDYAGPTGPKYFGS